MTGLAREIASELRTLPRANTLAIRAIRREYSRRLRTETGDVIKATMVGNVITTYKNGVQMGQVTDNTFLTGRPGFGFNEGINGDYGITRFTATDAPIATPPQANPAATK